MKNKLLFGLSALTLTAFAQTGMQFQFHKHSVEGFNFYAYHKDSIISLCKVGTVSGGNNAVALLNPNSNTCVYFNSPITPSVNPTMLMKNRQEGIIYSTSNGAYATSDGWNTSTLLSSLTYTPYNASSFGYTSFTGSGPYSVHFSANGTNWNAGVLSLATYPDFVKGKTKLFIYDSDKLHSSTNGGASFVTETYGGSQGAGKLYAADDDSLFIIGTNNFKVSVDGGSTWTGGTLPSTLQVVSAACKNGKEIMLHCVNSSLTQRSWFYSNNSGSSWTPLSLAANFGASGTLMASSNYFMLYPYYKTTDGANWPQLYLTVANSAYDVNFYGNVGLAGMANGAVLVSGNKGASFDVEGSTAFTSENIMAVKVLPTGKFLAADRKSNMWESVNNGQNWTKKYANTTNLVPYKILSSQNTNSIVCVRAGQPLVSVNGGSTYDYITVGGGQHSQAQKPVAGDMIDVGGSYPAPNYTLSAWEFNKVDMVSGSKTLLSSITSSAISTEGILDIHMANDNVGYFITSNTSGSLTTVYKTTNGWQNASAIATIPKYYNLARIQTFGTDTVMISGPNATTGGNTATYYHVSINGGNSWTQVNTSFTVPNNLLGDKVYKIHFFNANEYVAQISDGYAGPPVPGKGIYLQLKAVAGTVNGINNYVKADNVSKIILYPNPAHQQFQVKGAFEFDRVEIYNMNGQLVKHLEVRSGSIAEVDAEDMEAGIYFVKVFGGRSLVAQSKLIVVK